MAKLIVKTTDSHHELGFKRGDVVAVLDDNQDEGAMVRNGAVMPDGKGTVKRLFRIVNVPGTAAEYLSLQEKGEDVFRGENLMRPARKERLDLDSIETAVTTRLGRALSPIEAVSVTKETILSNKTLVAVESDIIL